MKRAGLVLSSLVLVGCQSTIEGSAQCIISRNSSLKEGGQEDLERRIGHYVLFTYDSAILQEDAVATLERQALFFKIYPNTKMVIEGHADERGTREYNIGLGERRATSVRDYLMANGVDASRLKIVSYGKERPAVLDGTEEVWAQNRRAVTLIEE